MTTLPTQITTLIINGIKNSEARRKLLALKTFPTLAEAINICRTEEAASKGDESKISVRVVEHFLLQTGHSGSTDFIFVGASNIKLNVGIFSRLMVRRRKDCHLKIAPNCLPSRVTCAFTTRIANKVWGPQASWRQEVQVAPAAVSKGTVHTWTSPKVLGGPFEHFRAMEGS